MTIAAAQGTSFQLEASAGDGYLLALAAGGGEIELLQAAFDALQLEDAVILDIGANIGFTALMMSRLRPDAQIIAFEPSPATFEFLKRNVRNNGCTNIEPVQLALGTEPGRGGWTQDPLDSSSAHLYVAGDAEVSVSTVDELVARMPKPPTFIKIDVEGAELAVFEGASRTIEAGKAVLLVELNSFSAVAYGDFSPKVLIGLILQRFERVFWVDNDTPKELRSDNSVLELLHRQFTTGNCVHDLLCIPAGISFDYQKLARSLERRDKPSRHLVDGSLLRFGCGDDAMPQLTEAPAEKTDGASHDTGQSPKTGIVPRLRRLVGRYVAP